jgi:hypothetical protein
LPLVDEEPKILFKFLVYSLSLAVSLRVEGCRGSELDTEQSIKLTSEFGYKLWSSVRHDSAW